MLKLIKVFFIFSPLLMGAQVGVNTTTPDASSIMDISSSDKGLLIPRMSSFPTSPAKGLLIYRLDLNGFYAWNGSSWGQTVFNAGGNGIQSLSVTGTNGIVVTGSPVSTSGNVSLSLSSVPNQVLQNSSINVSLGTTGTGPNVTGSPVALGGTVNINIPDAGATTRGIVSTGAQSFSGVKTFNNAPVIGGITPGNLLYTTSSGTVASVSIGAGLSFSSGTLNATGGGTSSGWTLNGNSGTTSQNFLGTTDNKDLQFKVSNTQAGFIGQAGSSEALSFGINATAAYKSTSLGGFAVANGNESVAVGNNAGALSYRSIAIGGSAKVPVGSNNDAVALGYNAIANSYQGIAIGANANTSVGNNGLAIGVGANATGFQSLALGNTANASAQNATAVGNGSVANKANTVILGNASISVGIGTSTPTSKLQVTGLPYFSSDAAAGNAGLTAGAFYQTSGTGTGIFSNLGVLMVKQ